MENRPTTGDLIGLAADRGMTVTPRQVERWRNARLLDRNVRHGSGQGQGTRWTYQADVAARFLTAARLVVVERCTLSEAAVRLWTSGFSMELDVLRGHLQRAAAPLRGLRAQLARWDAEEAGNVMVDGLRRRPTTRVQYGVRAWTDRERDGAAAFAEDLVEGYRDPGRGLNRDTVRRTKIFMGMTLEDDARLTAAGNDMDTLVNQALPQLVALAGLVDDVTDEELVTGRALCRSVLDNPEATREVLARAGASGPFVTNSLAPLNGAVGLLSMISAYRHRHALSASGIAPA